MSKSQHKRIAAQTTDEQSTEQVADLILWAVVNTQKDLKARPSRQHRFMKARILEYLEHDRAQTEARVRAELAAHEQAWISVDRKREIWPDNGQAVFVLDHGQQWSAVWNRDTGQFQSYEGSILQVTHWRFQFPLPPAPDVEGE